MEELSDCITNNNSASLLIPLERVRDSTLYGTKAKKTLVIYQIKHRFAHSRENQAQRLQLPDCLVDQILPKTTGRVINSHLQYEVLISSQEVLAVKYTRRREPLSIFLAVYTVKRPTREVTWKQKCIQMNIWRVEHTSNIIKHGINLVESTEIID